MCRSSQRAPRGSWECLCYGESVELTFMFASSANPVKYFYLPCSSIAGSCVTSSLQICELVFFPFVFFLFSFDDFSWHLFTFTCCFRGSLPRTDFVFANAYVHDLARSFVMTSQTALGNNVTRNLECTLVCQLKLESLEWTGIGGDCAHMWSRRCRCCRRQGGGGARSNINYLYIACPCVFYVSDWGVAFNCIVCFIWSVVVPKAIISLKRRIISSWIDFLHAPESRTTCYVGLLLPGACFLIWMFGLFTFWPLLLKSSTHHHPSPISPFLTSSSPRRPEFEGVQGRSELGPEAFLRRSDGPRLPLLPSPQLDRGENGAEPARRSVPLLSVWFFCPDNKSWSVVGNINSATFIAFHCTLVWESQIWTCTPSHCRLGFVTCMLWHNRNCRKKVLSHFIICLTMSTWYIWSNFPCFYWCYVIHNVMQTATYVIMSFNHSVPVGDSLLMQKNILYWVHYCIVSVFISKFRQSWGYCTRP